MILRIATLLMFSFALMNNAFAQLEPVPLHTDKADLRVTFDPTTAENDISEQNFVYSLIDEPMSITWVKILEMTTTREWTFAVCDKNRCYLPQISTMDFDMEPFDSSEMTVHLYRNFSEGDSAIVYVKLFRNDIENSDSLYLKVTFAAESTTPTAFSEIRKTDVEVFPNPASNYFSITSPTSIGEVVIYDILGRQVKSENLNGKHSATILINRLREGTYFISTSDVRGNHLKTSRLIKRIAGS